MGGDVPTHKLVGGSLAVDAGDPAFDGGVFAPVLDDDQRGNGFPRVVQGLLSSSAAIVDLGAFELVMTPEFTDSNPSVRTDGEPLDLATVTGATPPGGVFSGPGVSNGMFDPSGLAPGDHTLRYTITDANGIENFAEFTVTVLSIPTQLQLQRPKRFPVTLVGKKTRIQVLRLSNVGGTPATGLRRLLVGAGRREFRVTQPVLRTLAPGATTTMRAIFRPKKAGTRKALVKVYSATGLVTGNLLGKGTFDPDFEEPPRKRPR